VHLAARRVEPPQVSGHYLPSLCLAEPRAVAGRPGVRQFRPESLAEHPLALGWQPPLTARTAARLVFLPRRLCATHGLDQRTHRSGLPGASESAQTDVMSRRTGRADTSAHEQIFGDQSRMAMHRLANPVALCEG